MLVMKGTQANKGPSNEEIIMATQVQIGSVVVRWHDTRHVHEVPGNDAGAAWDIETGGELTVALSATAAPLSDVIRAVRAAQDFAAAAEMEYCQPGGEMSLVAEGLDDMGDIVLRIWRDGRRCDAVPVREMASLVPCGYTQGGGETSVAWMRDIARIFRDRPRDEWHDAIRALRPSAPAT